MPIPRAVEIANDNADKAIEADSAGFDINRVGLQDTEGISVVEDESSTDAGKINTQGLELENVNDVSSVSPSAAKQPAATETESQNQGLGQKIELTQEELAQKIDAGRKDLKGLFESRLKNMSNFAEENKALRKRVQELEEEAASIKTHTPESADKLRQKYPELASFDDEDVANITTFVSKKTKEDLDKILPEAMNGLRREIESGSKESSMRSFISQMEEKYPGFVNLDKTNNPKWVAFLDSDIEGTGGQVKFQEPALKAFNSMNVSALSKILDEFSRQSGYQFGSRRGDDSRVSAQARPRQSIAGKQRQATNKMFFRRSDVSRFNKDYDTRAIYGKMERKDVEQLKKDIEEAEDENRILEDR